MDAIDEVLNRIEQQKEEPELPEGITALELLRLAYRGKVKLTPQQARCAIESLPYETPKLSATAHVNYDFAAELEKAVERAKVRSGLPVLRVINAQPVEQLPAEKLKDPFARYTNNYRRR